MNCKLLVGFALAMALGCPGVSLAQGAVPPVYLKHSADPVQRLYSRALIGFTLNRKCRFLPDPATADYEKALNHAGGVFQGYVVAWKYVSSPDQATAYLEAMIKGAINFAALSSCDAEANEAVEAGYRTAQDFIPLLRELFGPPNQSR